MLKAKNENLIIISAVITRADGTVENKGIIAKSHLNLWDKFLNIFRKRKIKLIRG